MCGCLNTASLYDSNVAESDVYKLLSKLDATQLSLHLQVLFLLAQT
jgi:hypothetical protein